MDKTRNYNVKDVEMLMTAATSIENAIANTPTKEQFIPIATLTTP